MWRTALVAATLTVLSGVVVVTAGCTTGSRDVSQAVGLVAIALVLAGHLWVARGQSLVALVVTVVPGFPLLALTAAAVDPEAGEAVVWGVVAAAGLAVLGTAALTTWVGNRWGDRDGASVDEFFGWFD